MHMNSSTPKEKGSIAKKIGIILFWLLLWELADRIVQNRILLVGPINIVLALVEQISADDFWVVVSASFLRIAAGFLLSFTVGFILAMLSYRFSLLKDFLEPVIVTLKTIPMISFVIMLLIWVGNQALTIYLAFLIVLPIIYTNTLSGFQNTNKEMLEMAKVYNLSPWKRFMYIYRPSFMPFLISSCKISLGMSWKSGIMAEVIGTPEPSIGKEMYAAKAILQTPTLFAWTLIVIILSILFEKLFMLLLKQFNKPLGHHIGKGDET